MPRIWFHQNSSIGTQLGLNQLQSRSWSWTTVALWHDLRLSLMSGIFCIVCNSYSLIGPWFVGIGSQRKAEDKLDYCLQCLFAPFCTDPDHASVGTSIPQVCFHYHLHFRIINQNIGKRFLHEWVHLPSRSLELAGFYRYRVGVSDNICFFFLSPAAKQQFVAPFSHQKRDCRGLKGAF